MTCGRLAKRWITLFFKHFIDYQFKFIRQYLLFVFGLLKFAPQKFNKTIIISEIYCIYSYFCFDISQWNLVGKQLNGINGIVFGCGEKKTHTQNVNDWMDFCDDAEAVWNVEKKIRNEFRCKTINWTIIQFIWITHYSFGDMVTAGGV